MHLIFKFSRDIKQFSTLSGFVVMLSACGGGGSGGTPSPSPSVTPSVTPTVSVTPTPTPTPSSMPTTTPSVTPTITPSPSPSPTPTPDPATAELDCGEQSGSVEENALNSQAKAYILCKHNETRSRVALGNFATTISGSLPAASDMIRFQWDAKLEQVAQNYADQCVWEHNPNRESQYNALSPTDINGNSVDATISVGENLAVYGASNLTAATMEAAVSGYNQWQAEGMNYSFGMFGVTDHCTDDNTCGHFTQLIWANSYKVGCAVSFCPSGATGSGINLASSMLVCNYATAGNYHTQTPYDATASTDNVCSTADAGQSVCINGLTESEDYDDGL